MEKLISDLHKYMPKKESKRKSRDETLNNVKKIFSGKEMVIKAFEDGTIPLSTKSQHKKQAEKKEEEKKRKDDLKEFSAKINKIETEGGISRTVFERYFGYEIPTEMLSDLVNSGKKENTDLVASVRNRAEDLINEVLKTDENETKNTN